VRLLALSLHLLSVLSQRSSLSMQCSAQSS